MRRRLNIWDEMRMMQEQMDTMFNHMFMGGPANDFLLEDKSGENLPAKNFVSPVSDLYETDKEIIAEVDIPGVSKKDIKVNVTEDAIEISAEKKHEVEHKDDKKGVYRYERSYGGYCRHFPLPKNVDSEKAVAEYHDGVLKIKVPKLKVEETKKKYLDIK